MKKIVLAAFAAVSCLAFAATPVQPMSVHAAYESKSTIAEYVSLEHAPTIDGFIEVNEWGTAAFNTEVCSDGTRAQVFVMWNETGLYMAAKVNDDTVNASDLCNFWVSETYYEDELDLIYPNVTGAYYVCVNPHGDVTNYKPDAWEEGVDLTGKAVTAGQTMSIGYDVEVFVPRLGDTPFSVGKEIGFEISVDAYLEEGESVEDRHDYTYWNGNVDGWYWQDPSALGCIELVDQFSANGSFVAPEETPTPPNSSSSSSSPSSSSSSSSSSSKKSGGCGSVALGAPALLLIGFVLFKRKK